MWLIAGLGNPGAKHAKDRHNIGFMLIDAIAYSYHFPSFSQKFSAELSKGRIGDEDVLLLKPQTYMNHSGQAVGEAARFYQIAPEEIVVLHDELDLSFGKIRIKQGGGHGGHNGLRDIDRHIGKDYWRLRYGIDHPGHKDRVTGYVLSPFSKEEAEEVDFLNRRIADELPLFFSQGHERLMTRMAELGNTNG